MIAFVRGSVERVGADSVVVDVGGVGLTVQCPTPTAAALTEGEHVHLETSLVVREDSWSLFGFEDLDSREVFDILLGISGIGPRTAATVLSVHTPDSLRRAVAAEDKGALVKVPGIGPKGAARMLLELKDKIGAPAPAAAPVARASTDARGTVVAGLVGLGWSAKEAEAAVDDVLAERESATVSPAEVPEVMRSALKRMARA